MQPDEHQPTFTEAARRAQIIHGAIATINEIGYHRASLAEIAKRARVAKSAIVYYFGSKDALLLHVIDSVFSGLGVAVEAGVAAESAPAGRLRAYAEGYVSYIASHRREVSAGMTIVLSHRASDGTPLYLTESAEDTALLRSILSDGMEASTFRPLPLDTAVRIVESLLDVAITVVQHDLEADLDALSAEIVAFLSRGLADSSDDIDGGSTSSP